MHFIQIKKYNQKLVDVFLKKNIPEYMVPHYLFHIKKFPLTRNIKLDIDSLIKIARRKLNVKVNLKKKLRKSKHKIDNLKIEKLLKFLNNTINTTFKLNKNKTFL